jgi:hypothetical protein
LYNDCCSQNRSLNLLLEKERQKVAKLQQSLSELSANKEVRVINKGYGSCKQQSYRLISIHSTQITAVLAWNFSLNVWYAFAWCAA